MVKTTRHPSFPGHPRIRVGISFPLFLISLPLSLGWGGPVWAVASTPQLTPQLPSQPTPQLAEVVVVATRTAQPLATTAASVSVVDQEEIAQAQGGTVSAVLKREPGVEFGGGPRIAGEVPTIRGQSGANITLLVDGARQNDTTSPGMKTPLYIDPYFLQRIEVLRGSSSSLYGSGGLGGVMSFTTLSARDDASGAPGEGVAGGVRLGAASADGGRHSNARVQGVWGKGDALVAVGHHEWGSIRQGGGSELAPNDGLSTTALFKFGVEPAAGRRIELSHNLYQGTNLQVNNPQATDFRSANLPIDKPAVQRVHVDASNTVLRAQLLGPASGVPDPEANTLGVTAYRSELKQTNDRSPDPAITNVLYSETVTITQGLSLQGSTSLGQGAIRHRLTGGGDYFRDQQSAVSATVANPAAVSTVIRNGVREVGGLFVQDEISLGGGWRVTPSLRGDRYQARVADGALRDNEASRVSPKVVVSWQNPSGLLVYGHYGEAFRAPTVNELYQNFTSMGLSNFLPNPDLRPEKDRSLELGAKGRQQGLLTAADRFSWQLSAYDSRVRDLIQSTNLGGMTPAGATAAQLATYAGNCAATGLNCTWQYRNVAHARRRGGEAEARYGRGDWEGALAYSRVRVTDEDQGSGLYSPPDKLTLRLTRQLGSGLTLAWTSLAAAAQDSDATVLRRRPGYSLHDLSLTWQGGWLGKSTRIDAALTNLTDKRYSPYQSGNAYAYTYQEGRSLRVALTMDF